MKNVSFFILINNNKMFGTNRSNQSVEVSFSSNNNNKSNLFGGISIINNKPNMIQKSKFKLEFENFLSLKVKGINGLNNNIFTKVLLNIILEEEKLEKFEQFNSDEGDKQFPIILDTKTFPWLYEFFKILENNNLGKFAKNYIQHQTGFGEYFDQGIEIDHHIYPIFYLHNILIIEKLNFEILLKNNILIEGYMYLNNELFTNFTGKLITGFSNKEYYYNNPEKLKSIGSINKDKKFNMKKHKNDIYIDENGYLYKKIKDNNNQTTFTFGSKKNKNTFTFGSNDS